MEYRQLGNSKVNITPITFGAWAIGGWMWGGTDRKDAIEAIHASIDNGITSIDTAPVYGFGLSEELVGEAIKGKDRTQLQLLTKFGLRWDADEGKIQVETVNPDGSKTFVRRHAKKESVIKECEDSLRRLGTDYIDLLQIHWPDLDTPIEEPMEAMSQLLEEGKIRAAGVCNYNTAQVEEALQVVPLVSNQVPYSMVHRGIEQDVIPQAIEKNMQILAYSPLQRGLLTGKITPDYKFAEGDHRPRTPQFQPDFIRKTNQFLDRIRPIAEAHNSTLAQLVIHWTIRQPSVIALVGARNVKQATENAKAMELNLSSQELTTIRTAIEESGI